jgi:hypothetical protein
MKILHLADLHIREKSLPEIDTCLQFIIRTAQEERPDLAVIAGDVFDSREVKVDSEAAIVAIGFVSALANICPVAIITGTVLHEGTASRILGYARGKHEIRVATMPEQVFLYQGSFYSALTGNTKPDAILSLIPTITKRYFQTAASIEDADKEIAARMNGIFLGFGAGAAQYPETPHALAFHGGISGAALPSGHVRTGMDIEISTDQIEMAGPGGNFMGAFYPGPLYSVKVDEHDCGFYIHELYGSDFVACLGHIHQVQKLGGIEDPNSRHILTPCEKTVRIALDFTQSLDWSMDGRESEIREARARVDVKVWQDQAETIDFERIKQGLILWGASSVDIRITRIPRETVRAESVLAASTLADKITEQARIKGETVEPAVLEMARLLEGSTAEEMIKMAMNARF